MTDVASHYLQELGRQFRGHKRLAEGAISQLQDEELFSTPDPEANSVAVLMKHMAGNMRSRFTDFLTTDGEKPDRHRDQEFEMKAHPSRQELMDMWESGWEKVFSALAALKSEDVTRTVKIRGEPHTVLQAFNRALAHYAQHTGQIVFLAKHIRSGNWSSLSIPRGKSEEYNRKPLTQRKPGPSGPRAG